MFDAIFVTNYTQVAHDSMVSKKKRWERYINRPKYPDLNKEEIITEDIPHELVEHKQIENDK